MDMLSEVAGKATVNERRNTTFPKATILLCVALVAAGLFCSILWRNGGEFAYTLDAPYTHMALAGHILQGTYGLNPGEPASPSSSILYPFCSLIQHYTTSLRRCYTQETSSYWMPQALMRSTSAESCRLSRPEPMRGFPAERVCSQRQVRCVGLRDWS